MSDIQLFRLAAGTATELPGRAAAIEKQLHRPWCISMGES